MNNETLLEILSCLMHLKAHLNKDKEQHAINSEAFKMKACTDFCAKIDKLSDNVYQRLLKNEVA